MGKIEYPLKNSLSGIICRMGLIRKDDLQGSPAIIYVSMVSRQFSFDDSH
jgi:hypothetical protein